MTFVQKDLVTVEDLGLTPSGTGLGWTKYRASFRLAEREAIDIATLVVRDGTVAASEREATSYGHVQPPNSGRSEVGKAWFVIQPGGYGHPGGDRLKFRFGGPERPLVDGPVLADRSRGGFSDTGVMQHGGDDGGTWGIIQHESWKPKAGTGESTITVLMASRRRPLTAGDPVYGDLLNPGPDGVLRDVTASRPYTLSDADIAEILAMATALEESL